MIQVSKKKKETNANLLRRFSKKMKQSGNMMRFKSSQFMSRKKSDLTKKQEALAKKARKEKMESLYKLGKINYRPK